MGSRMETFEQIRRDRDREGLSVRALALRHGVHRRAVRQALASPVPPAKRPPASRPAPALGSYHALIDAWLERRPGRAAKAAPHREADLAAPRRGSRARRSLSARSAAMCTPAAVSSAIVGEAFVPQHHEPGKEAEVDWGEAWVTIAAQRVKVHLFQLRLCHSGAAFAVAVPERDPAGVPRGLTPKPSSSLAGCAALIRYDNLTSAVKQVLKGRRRSRVRPLRRAALALPVRVAVHDRRVRRRP